MYLRPYKPPYKPPHEPPRKPPRKPPHEPPRILPYECVQMNSALHLLICICNSERLFLRVEP